jgi:hypothetical protein
MRLIFVGWDAADWKVIDPLLARREMPCLAALLNQGVSGNSSDQQQFDDDQTTFLLKPPEWRCAIIRTIVG